MSTDSPHDSFEDSDEELCNTKSLYLPRKRRRLNENPIDNAEDTQVSDQTSSSSSLRRSYSTRKFAIEKPAVEAKSKSKYKIHIPKNSEIPKDAFYTQPPCRSSSPYRIDQFHWQKPQRSARNPSQTQQRHKRTNITLADIEIPTQSLLSDNPTLGAPKRLQVSVPARAWPDQVSDDDVICREYDHRISRTPSPGPDDTRIQNYEDVLADLPSDAFSSPTGAAGTSRNDPIPVCSQPPDSHSSSFQVGQNQRLAAPLANLRQTTLFGAQAHEASAQPYSESGRRHNWPLANREESPTHHKLDREALTTWVYPTNLGLTREYQYSIVARGLYHNTLVALPTGLGKTFIAATIMLNWFRWTTDTQIVFVAPTKPLVSQQVKACFEIAGIPRSATTMLTGGTPPGIRAEEWRSKRVFFMTPQTIVNDLKTGICDPKRIVLLVVDEAHRATGGYAYVEVVKFLNRFNSSFRVLALTATPGASIEAVQEVIDGLGISRIEIRTEESIDIRQYVHSRKVETVLFENSEEMVMVMDLFSKALKPVLDKLNAMNAYWARDPCTLTPYGCNQARIKWMGSDAGRNANMGVKGMVNTIFSVLASLAHGMELLKFHGIGPFFHKALGFREGDGEKGGKYRKQIIECKDFQTMMTKVQQWINDPDFVGHPKLDYLQSVVLRHFVNAGDGRGASDPSSTRIMVFAHYRDSAEEIARVLKRNDPMVRPHVFVGQANSKGSDGMDQKTQLQVIQKFQQGIYNTLVATSIGEEGLDIGEVDLIICYDASASPIRMLQRMGRTGRKRAGNIIVLLMKGKEEENFIKAKDNYEKMQKEIAAGTKFNFRDDQSRRIVPKDIQPIVDKKHIEIPLENSQAGLPEPKKRVKVPKRPAKKFHMPDGVRSGFVKASRIDDADPSHEKNEGPGMPPRVTPEPIPALHEVLLTAVDEKKLALNYLDVKGDAPQIVEPPRLDAFPEWQRVLRPTKHVAHGRTTTMFVRMLESLRDAPKKADNWYRIRLGSEDRENGNAQERARVQVLRRHLAPSGPKTAPEGVFPRSAGIIASSTSRQPASHLRDVSPTPIVSLAALDDMSNDETHDDSLIDFPRGHLKFSSGLSRPQPVAQAFYQPPASNCRAELDSDEDLPELNTLVKKKAPISAAAASTGTKVALRPSQRNRKRMIIEEDSENE
jgi:ATP-dependent DNA helicase MPH1